MSLRLSIRNAPDHTTDVIAQLYEQSCAQAVTAVKPPGTPSHKALQDIIANGCMLQGWHGRTLVAACGIDLDKARLLGPVVLPGFRGAGLGRKMLQAAERMAVRFGIFELRATVPQNYAGFFEACKYTEQDGPSKTSVSHQLCTMQRRFAHRQTRYGARIAHIHTRLGIPAGYGRKHRLALQSEAATLAPIERDIHNRRQQLDPAAAAAWQDMQSAAASQQLTLQVASAFRPVDYQAGIIERKSARGLSMDEILAVSAAPGFSEHHTGRALDITTPGFEPLEEVFESSAAFAWLTRHGGKYGFRLSYPRDNHHGISYEPWHWCYTRP